MTDEQTAEELCKWLEPMAEPAGMISAFWRAAGPRGRNRGDALIDMEAHKAAIVRALQAAREEGRKSATPVIHNVEEFYRETTSDGK